MPLKNIELTDSEEQSVYRTIFCCFVPCALNVLYYEGIAFQETSVPRFDVFLDNVIRIEDSWRA
jgi:hypothetical protein